jgi:hypothetical protein
MTGVWRKLRNDNLHDLYCSSNIMKKIKWRRMGEECCAHGGDEKWLKILIGEPEEKRVLDVHKGSININSQYIPHIRTGIVKYNLSDLIY